MSRCRSIKPGLWLNEDLAEVSIPARYLFPALWCLADKDGRLEYRPKKIKIEVYPYDEIDIISLIAELHGKKFISVYENEGCFFIQINNFIKHQNPHPKEKSNNYPEPVNICNYDGNLKQFNFTACNVILPFPSSSLVSSPLDLGCGEKICASDDGAFFLTAKKKKLSGKKLEWFESFWVAFDFKHGKAAAADSWLVIPAMDEALVENIIAGAHREAATRGDKPKWAQGWLTERRWEDEHRSTPRLSSAGMKTAAAAQRFVEKMGGAT